MRNVVIVLAEILAVVADYDNDRRLKQSSGLKTVPERRNLAVEIPGGAVIPVQPRLAREVRSLCVGQNIRIVSGDRKDGQKERAVRAFCPLQSPLEGNSIVDSP